MTQEIFKPKILRLSATIFALSSLFVSCQVPSTNNRPLIPNASFTFSPASPVAGQTVQFTDTSTGSPTSWQWSFGDGSTSTTQNPGHAYAAVSSYSVTLTVSSAAGSDSASHAINILPSSALVASFTYSPDSPVVNLPVQFTDTSTGSPISWEWAFGDGTTSATKNPSHAYTAAGTYTVSLTIRAGSNLNSTGKTITATLPKVITATSPALANVKAAVDSANVGDTVIVPPGVATWTSQLSITKSIILKGAGIGQTIITAGFNASDPGSPNETGNYIFAYTPAHPGLDFPFRFSGFTFDCASKVMGIILANSTQYAQTTIRIDHIKLLNLAGNAMRISGNIWGVVDNCEWSGLVGVFGAGKNSWDYFTYTYGASQTLYFEDCTFTDSPGLGSFQAGEQAGRYSIRHCIFNMVRDAYPAFDAHGNYSGTGPAMMGEEIYENTINANGHDLDIFDHRGGKALVFNNNVNNGGTARIQCHDEYDDYGYAESNPGVSALDGSPQYPHMAYYFNNRLNGGYITEHYISGTIDYAALGHPPYRRAPQKDKEVWWETDLTSPYTFNGSTGVGVGLLSARPATCTTEGVAWWATDESKLYRWHNRAWGLFYTPYTYPHPLRTLLSN